MLANEGVVELRFVGKDNSLAVFLGCLSPTPVRRMHRQSEISESHEILPQCNMKPTAAEA
jgi:hypothetical protein